MMARALDPNLPPATSIEEAVARFQAGLSTSDPFVVGVNDAILPMAISDPTLPDNPIIYVNPAFELLTGYPAAEVVGRNCRFLQGPATGADEIAQLRDAIAARRRITLDLMNYRRDGSPFWNRLMVAPVFGDDGTLRYFFASQLDVTLERERLGRLEAERRGLLSENERVRREMRDTQARLDLAMHAGQLGTWVYDPVSHQLDTSDACKRTFGFEPEDAFTYDDFVAMVHPEDRAAVQAAIDATVQKGAPYSIDYRVTTRDGERRWIAANGTLLNRRDGSPLTMAGFVTDISARKDAEEQSNLLAGELTHRVKNTLATVAAVVNQSLRTATSLAEARDAVGSRIANLASAHDVLVRGEVEGALIGTVVQTAIKTFDDKTGALFTVEGPEIMLTPSVSLALSMALHELATNAVKYGALSQPGGHVDVTWTLDGEETGNRSFDFLWRESGGPTVVPPTRVGFGSRMIDRLMAKHMRGTAKTSFPPEGVQFRLQSKL